MPKGEDNLIIKDEEVENDPRLRNFDWEKTKTFYYVAKFGSFGNAGRFLNISQSALSRQVIYLEQHLGYPLFARHRHGVTLTRKGEELFALVETIYIGFKSFTQNSHVNRANGKKRKIRIATTHALASYVFNDLILDYNKSHSNLVFELIGEDHLLDIFLNDVDITIHGIDESIQDVSNKQGVQQEYLFCLAKRLYASAEYIAEYGEPQTVEELKHHRLIAFGHPELYPYGDVNWILKLGMPNGKLHEPVFTSNSVECMITAAKRGVGIVSSYREMRIIRESNLKNILPHVQDKTVKDYIIYPDYLKNDPDIIEFYNYLKNTLNKQAPPPL